jgi:hypothetical protein
MILDTFNEFSDSQAETTVAAHASDSVVDLGAAGDAYGNELYVHIEIDDACTTGSTSEVQFALQTSSDEAFTSPVTLWESAAIDSDTLVAGYKVAVFRIPSGCLQYLRTTYTITTAVLTGGSFSAYLTPDVQDNDFTS